MRQLVLVAFVSIAFAAKEPSVDYDQIYSSIYPHQIKDHEFRSGHEYRYFYDGQVMTGIPGTSKQHSATRIQCLVTIQIQNGKSLMKLTNIRMGQLNRYVPNPRAALPFGAFEQAEIQPKLRQQLEKSLQFKWEQGQIDDLVLDSKDEPWSVNIKRGILNMLNLKLKAPAFHADTQTNQIDVSAVHQTHYRTLEKTLEGQCEAIYNIESLPSRHHSSGRPVLNVTKSINFDQCQTRPEVKYNWRFHQNCVSCNPKIDDDEKTVKSATVVKYNITGDREKFLIESVKVESHYLLVPFSEEANVIATYVNQTLVLYKTVAIQKAIEEPKSPVESQSDLIYSLEWDLWREKFYLEGEKTMHNKMPYSTISNRPQMATDLIEKLVKYTNDRVTTLAPKYLDRLITVLKMMPKSEIEQIYTEFFKGTTTTLTSAEHKKKAKDVILHAIALCGTHDCVLTLIEKIESGELPTYQAAAVIAQLHHTPVVSPKMILAVKRLAEHSKVKESLLLKQSTYLLFGSMVWTACGKHRDQLAIESYRQMLGKDKEVAKQTCTESQKKEFADWMWARFESAKSAEEQILCLKMIGNSGLSANVQKLEKIIYQQSKQYHVKTRVAAVKASWLLIDRMPKKVQRLLMPIMMDKYEDSELRTSAAYFVLQSYPDRFLLNMIAKDLNVEPNFQYRSFLWTYLNDLANLTNPCYKEFATDLKSAIRFAHKVDTLPISSTVRRFGFYSKSYKTGFDIEPHWIMANNSFVPRQLNLVQTGTGYFSKWASTVGLSSIGLDQALWNLFKNYEFPSTRDPESRKNARWMSELKNIHDGLKVSKNFNRSPKEPLAYLYLRRSGQEVFYYPLKTELIKRFAENGVSSFDSYSLQPITQLINKPFDVSYATLLSDFKYKIPTTIGMPVTFSYRMPLVANIKGRLEPEIHGDMRSFSLHANVKPSVAVKLVESVELWSPVVNNGLKVEVEGSLFTPIKAELRVNLASHEQTFRVVFEPSSTQTHELLTLQSRPITYVRQWPQSLKVWQEPTEKTIQGTEHNRIYTINRSYLESLFGINMKVKGRVHMTPAVRLANTPFSPYSGPNKLVIECEPGRNVPQRIEFSLKTKLHQSREPINSELSNSPIWSDESSSSESDENQIQISGRRERRSAEGTSSRATRKHEITATLKTYGANSERDIKLTTEINYSPNFDMLKLNGQLNVGPLPKLNTHPYSACFESEFLFPSVSASKLNELYDKKVHGEVQLSWSASHDKCSKHSDSFIRATLQAERSAKQLEMETDNINYWQCRRSSNSPVSCEKYMNTASDLSKYLVKVDYKNVPVPVQNVTSKLWRALKAYYFMQTDVAQIAVRNPENKLTAIVRIDPFNQQLLNVTVKTPHENVSMYDIPLPIYGFPMNIKRSFVSRISEKAIYGSRGTPTCEVSTDRVNTFDNAEFSLKMGNCWTVLAKDCSTEPTFAVLVKKTSGGEQEEKTVKILTPYGKVKLIKRPEQPLILEKNGEGVNLAAGEEPLELIERGRVIMRCVAESDSYVKCSLPQQQLKVHFDGYNVNVKAISPKYVGRQCGVCGNMDFDPNPETEFQKIASERDWYEPETDIRKALHNYIIKDDSCSRPDDYKEMCDDEQCNYRQTPFPNEFAKFRSPYDMPDEFNQQSEVNPIRKTMKIERNGHKCFSKHPVYVCPGQSYPSEVEKHEMVKFICKSKHSTYWNNFHESSSSSSSSTDENSKEKETESSSTETANSSESSESSSSSSTESALTGERRKGESRSSSSHRVEQQKRRFHDSHETEQSEIEVSVRIPKSCRRF